MNLRPQFNEYNEREFCIQFEKTELYKDLVKDFSRIIYNRECNFLGGGTPRQYLGDANFFKPTFFASALYYLSFLIEKNPKEIYDLGCGWNIFKKYIPNIIGVGAENPNSPFFYADIHDQITEKYIATHQEAFESVFSCCALHFIPLQQVRKQVLDFASMIRPGGRGWIALNALRMVEQDVDFLRNNIQDGENLSRAVDRYIRTELNELPFEVLVFDVYVDSINNGTNGNIHIVFEKKE